MISFSLTGVFFGTPCRRIWMFLMFFDLVSGDRVHPLETSVKVRSRSNIRNPVKTPHFLQVSSRSLGGHGGSRWSWCWWQMIRCIMEISSWSNIKETIRKHIYLKCNVSWNYGRMEGRTVYFILLICRQKYFFWKNALLLD